MDRSELGKGVVAVLGQGSVYGPELRPTSSLPRLHLCQGGSMHLPGGVAHTAQPPSDARAATPFTSHLIHETAGYATDGIIQGWLLAWAGWRARR